MSSMCAMPRGRRQSQSSPPGQLRGSNRCRKLIPIDGGPIRARVRREYEKVRQSLAKAQSEVERFKNHDQPQFQRWVSANFGRLLTQLRELNEKMARTRALIYEVEMEVFATDCSYERAYQRVTRRQQAQAQAEAPEQEGGQDPGSGSTKKKKRRDNSRKEDDFESKEEKEFEDAFDDFFSDLFEEPAPPKPPAGSSRLRELYRSLVRLLHPDHNHDLTPAQREMWHQAQTAYEERDENQLEVLLTLCQLEQKGSEPRGTSISVLQRIIEQLKRSLSELRRQLRAHKKDPAWGFSQRTNHELLHHQMQRQLEEELYTLGQLYQETQNLINRWSQPTLRRRRSKRDWF